MTIYLVFYTKAEDDEEMFLSAHVDEAGAQQAAWDDAKEQGFITDNVSGAGNWRWGVADRRNPDVSGDGLENSDILSDWDGDLADAGQYQIHAVPLHGAETRLMDRFREWVVGPDFVANTERRCVDGKIFVAALVGLRDHPRPGRRKAVRS